MEFESVLRDRSKIPIGVYVIPSVEGGRFMINGRYQEQVGSLAVLYGLKSKENEFEDAVKLAIRLEDGDMSVLDMLVEKDVTDAGVYHIKNGGRLVESRQFGPNIYIRDNIIRELAPYAPRSWTLKDRPSLKWGEEAGGDSELGE